MTGAVLVTGAAGYIGSVALETLAERGVPCVALDDLSRGHAEALEPGVTLYRGSVGDAALVREIAQRHDVDACIHFAGLSLVGESVAEPARYLAHNVGQTLALLEALLGAGVGQFVFSSSAAVYGEPVKLPIPEDHALVPTNPYGASKRAVEAALADLGRFTRLRWVALRYFNAAGATARHGEHHDPETHLIPNVLRAAAGRAPAIELYGRDYDTPDGTAIRDYIHVSDLAVAHVAALEHLRSGGDSIALNLGTGAGHSVQQVIDTAAAVTGRPIEVVPRPRRPGDPARLVADPALARRVLRWTPVTSALDQIIQSAWTWHLAHPAGYGSA